MSTKITNKLLKEAIVDAEAVRETAVANAKLVLEESITPQIRDIISERLREEAKAPVKEAEEITETEEIDDADELDEAAPEKPHEDGEAEGGSDFPADSSDVGQGENKEPSDDSFDESGIGDGGENESDSSTDWYDDWNESEFDLDEVIKELEEDIQALSEMDYGEEDDDDEDDMEEAAPRGHDHHAKNTVDDEDDRQTQKNPNAFASAELKRDGEDPEEDEEAPQGDFGGDDEGDDEELDLEAILRELEADDEDVAGDLDGQPQDAGTDDSHKMAQELARFKGELDEYREAVKILRGRLQEVNLLNAKLLFTNKMFRKESLTEDQKVRIVESLDRATTVREVKLVFTALVENLGSAARSINASRKKIVAEGLASKASPSTAPKSSAENDSEMIVESAVAKRFKELAGII